MNERILELAVQASHQSPDGYPVTIPYSKDFAEKFAELIVRECTSLFDGTKEMKTVGMLTHSQIVEQIQKHFGVER